MVATVLIGALAVSMIGVSRNAWPPPLWGGGTPDATLITSVGVAVAIDGIVLRIWGSQCWPSRLRCRPALDRWAARSNRRRSCSSVLVIVLGWVAPVRETSSGWPRWRRPRTASGHGPRCRCCGCWPSGRFAVAGLDRRRLWSRGRVRDVRRTRVGRTTWLSSASWPIAIRGSGSHIGRSSADFDRDVSVRRSRPGTPTPTGHRSSCSPLFLLILLTRPRGLFGGAVEQASRGIHHARTAVDRRGSGRPPAPMLALGASVLVAPWLGLGAYWSDGSS